MTETNTPTALSSAEASGVPTTSPEVSTPGLIEQATKVTQELKEQLDRREKLLLQEQELQMRATLGGRSFAGAPVAPILTEEQKAIEEAKAFLKGTGLNPFK